jgi:hypothetical protein
MVINLDLKKLAKLNMFRMYSFSSKRAFTRNITKGIFIVLNYLYFLDCSLVVS